jgi:hypothetical protein
MIDSLLWQSRGAVSAPAGRYLAFRWLGDNRGRRHKTIAERGRNRFQLLQRRSGAAIVAQRAEIRRWPSGGGAVSKLAAFVVAAICLGAPTGAQAGIEFCSNFPYKLFVAIAYSQDDQFWISRGWLELDNGDCSEFDASLQPATIYYRGESVSYRNAQGASISTVWSNPGHKFAIWEKDNFNYWNASEKVLNATLVDFSLAAERIEPGASITVTFEADGVHTTTTLTHPKLDLQGGASPPANSNSQSTGGQP